MSWRDDFCLVGVAERVEWLTREKHSVLLNPVANHISLWTPGNTEEQGLQLRRYDFLRAPQD